MPSEPNSPRLIEAETNEISQAITDGTAATLPVDLLVAAVGLLLVGLAAFSAIRWYRNRHDNPHPLLIFRRAANSAGLSLYDQLALVRLAKARQLPSPITLIVSARTLRLHTAAHAQARSARSQAAADRLEQHLTRIHRQLFGPPPTLVSLPAEPTATPVDPA
ncbi:MAG: hypothetical protein AAGI68_12030 [Planctomycetota bacterium]